MKGDKRLLLICGAITLCCLLLLMGVSLFGGSDESAELPETKAADLPPADRAYRDSSEYAASAAWESYRADCDPDGSIFNAYLTGSVEIDTKYELYPVYSQEMADQLEKLLSTHGLKLHESIHYFYDAEELYAAAGTGAFLTQGGSCMGYLYNDGSFHFDSSAYLSGSLTVEYRFDRQMRGVFSEETLATGHGGQSWSSEGSDGTPLHMALGDSECVIHAALPESFVSITVLQGAATAENPGGITAAALEELAGRFDWSALK